MYIIYILIYFVFKYLYKYKFSLRSGMSVACKEPLAEIRIYLVRWFKLFHQLQLYVCAAVGATAQMYLLTTYYVPGISTRKIVVEHADKCDAREQF